MKEPEGTPTPSEGTAPHEGVKELRENIGEDVEAYIKEMMKHFNIPGASIAVIDGEKTFASAYGYAVLPDQKATPYTIYETASTAKAITNATLLSVLNSTSQRDSVGRPLTINSRIADIIPEDWVLTDGQASAQATLADAASHRLGLPRHDLCYGGDPDRPEDKFEARDAVRLMRFLEPTAGLRERMQYNNMGYMALQHVIETLVGKDEAEKLGCQPAWIGTVMKERILEPLGMLDTHEDVSRWLGAAQGDVKTQRGAQGEMGRTAATLARGYTHDEERRLHLVPYIESRLVGQGGLFSNVMDYAKWARAAMRQKIPGLNAKSHELLFRPLSIAEWGPPEHARKGAFSQPLYGLGWTTWSYMGVGCVSHGGNLPGFSSLIAFVPEMDWGFVMFANSDLLGDVLIKAVFGRLLDDKVGVREPDRFDIVPGLEKGIAENVEEWRGSKGSLFPNADPEVKMTLPLEAYAGRYWNPGYRELCFAVAEPKETTPVDRKDTSGMKKVLRAEIKRRLRRTVELEHVSGDHFVAWMDLEPHSLWLFKAGPAEFRVGADGKVTHLGIALEPAMAQAEDVDLKVWFKRKE